jgi:hypothetical protein
VFLSPFELSARAIQRSKQLNKPFATDEGDWIVLSRAEIVRRLFAGASKKSRGRALPKDFIKTYTQPHSSYKLRVRIDTMSPEMRAKITQQPLPPK